MRDASEGTLRVEVLGAMRGWRGDQLLDLGEPKQRALLGVLATRAGRTVSFRELLDAIWGNALPASATSALYTYVARIRRLLEPARPPRSRHGVLASAGSGYLLRLAPAQVDVGVFEQLLNDARRQRTDGDLRASVRALDSALTLWRGDPWAGVDGPFAETERTRLTELRLAAVEDHAEMLLELGQHDGLADQLTVLVVEYPFRERLAGLLMLVMYRAGRQADALMIYRRTRELLDAELGIEPGTGLRQLQQRILRADPGLTLAALAPAPAGRVSPAARAMARPRRPAPVPRQLPPDAAAFTGRRAELRRVTEMLSAAGHRATVSAAIVCLDGMAGLGKSALAIHAAHRLARHGGYRDGQLYVDLRGSTPGTRPLRPLDALGLMLRGLGYDQSGPPKPVAEAAALFRSLSADRRLLLVLDNARDEEQIRSLVPASPASGVLVTGRQVLTTTDGAGHLHLAALPEDDALLLLGALAGAQRVAAEPAEAVELVRYCGHLPLAIRIAAARLAARPHWPLAALARRLADDSRRLDELRAGKLALAPSLDVSVRILRDQGGPGSSAAIRAYAVLGRAGVSEIGLREAATIIDKPEAVVRQAMELLVDARLLETTEPDRYYLPDLLRLHARAQPQQDKRSGRCDHTASRTTCRGLAGAPVASEHGH